MIGYKDFKPEGCIGYLMKDEMNRTIDMVNEWVKENGVEVVSIETIRHPSILAGEEFIRLFYIKRDSR